ncbi:YitT family protein [Salibacterium salarium]|uniref:YitT family protein n=1 Tax=Salibacterium salarium TaxID=284579 RepID=A0A3R9P233_9BACI|nr:YitT family protein [Salibacterium salarium]RSL31195.1 YitT family protein [Salibacterium salarium]
MITRNSTLFKEIQKVLIIVVSTIVMAVGLNMFLIPANVFANGATGIAQILAALLPLSTGMFLFLINIPIAVLGWYKVGKIFTFYSFIHVALTTFFLEIIPIEALSDNILLNGVFGGVITAVGAALPLKWGASAGGLDVVALVLARISDGPVGNYFFILNGIIVIAAGLLFDWEIALYTLLTLYVSSRVIDTIHTRHVKVTAFIVTKQPEALREAIHKHITRGITRIPAKGGYDYTEKEVLMIVITRYELFALKEVIEEVDEQAFTNIVNTAGIYGMFRKSD